MRTTYRVRSDYDARRRSVRGDAVKQRQRDDVLAHVHRHHVAPRMEYFSLPCTEWAVESVLAREYPSAYCTGVEVSHDIATRSLCNMPGGYVSHDPPGVRREPKYVSSAAALYVAKASDFLRGEADYRYTAAWLDLTTNFSMELVECCRWLPRRAAACDVPLAVTFQVGREHLENAAYLALLGGAGGAVERRCRAIATVLGVASSPRPLTVTDTRVYKTSAVTMCVLYVTLGRE